VATLHITVGDRQRGGCTIIKRILFLIILVFGERWVKFHFDFKDGYIIITKYYTVIPKLLKKQ
jgi:hypothetical protein